MKIINRKVKRIGINRILEKKVKNLLFEQTNIICQAKINKNSYIKSCNNSKTKQSITLGINSIMDREYRKLKS